jgi:non-specific serine/threonine protein kinase
MALNNLGKVQTLRGELGQARGQLHEALTLSHRLGNRRRMAYILHAVAALAAAEGQAERAVRLAETAAAAIAAIGAAYPPHARRIQVVPHARSQPASGLPQAETMSLEHAVQESLSWLAAGRRSADEGAAPAPAFSAAPAQPTAPGAASLTRREREVVALLALGMTNRQIGEELVVTEGTAENYVQHVLVKLGFKNRAQIAVWAVENRLGRAPDPA